MKSSSYKFKSKFYGTLNIDKDTRKFLKKYSEAITQILNGETIFFVEKDKNENDKR